MVWGTENWIKASNDFQERGEKGLNKGIPFRINSLNKYISGTQRGRYLLYFAGPGVGKSRIVYDQHIFVPYDYILENSNIDLHIHLWSLEINPTFIIGGAKIYWLYTRKNILTDINHLYSIGEEKLSSKVKQLVESQECVDYINGLSKVLHIYTGCNKHSIHKIIMDFATKRGKYIYEGGELIDYIPNNPNELVVTIVDHVALINNIRGESKKQTIDDVSDNFKLYRDKLHYAPIIIQQINPEKYEKDSDKILPHHEDLRDSKNTFQDCDNAISLGNPFNHGIRNFLGYKIAPETSLSMDGLEDRFRVAQVVKNRWGNVSVVIPMLFIGEVGYYTNIDPPNKINYAKIGALRKI